MGETTGIGWTDHTHNEWIGCTEAGPGCDFCYARDTDFRYQYGVPKAVAAANREVGIVPHWGPHMPRYRTSEGNRRKPFTWDRAAAKAGRPAKVFAHSLSDVFDNQVPSEWRIGLWQTIRDTPHLRWILVTKRIGNAEAMLPVRPFDNAILLATVVNQPEIDRDGPKLAALKAAGRVRAIGFSVEPQLGALLMPDEVANVADWVIGGGESAQKPRKGQPQKTRDYNIFWARVLMRQCKFHDVAYFEKQLGARPHDSGMPVTLKDRQAGANPDEWPADLRVQEFPEMLKG